MTRGRPHVFGSILSGKVCLSKEGKIVESAWLDLPAHYPHVRLDEFVVMPDHFHGIVWLIDTFVTTPVRAGLRPARHKTGVVKRISAKSNRHGLPEIVRAFKSFSARRINELQGSPGKPVWCRDDHERIIRDDHALETIRHYIRTNSERW